jgi:archaellum component FlaC
VAKMSKITILSVLLVIVLFGMASCSPTVSQEEYDRMSNELSAIQSQLVTLQSKLTEAELLETQYKELMKQFNTVSNERKTIQAEYEELSTEYEDLNKQFEELSTRYDLLIEETTINEEDVEQAVFKLINQERKNNGLDELMWGVNLYKKAIAHSRHMATDKRLEYPDFGWQEVYWAAGHSTTDAMANAAFLVWKNRFFYERTFLNGTTKYGAVAVYKSGEIFYITYLADFFQ